MNVYEAVKYLKEISWKIGTMSVERLSEKDGEKMRECIEFLESRIEQLMCNGKVYSTLS